MSACCRSFGTAAGGADVDKGHGHVSIEKMQLVLDLDGGRGLLRNSVGTGRRRRLLYWKDPPAESQRLAQQEEKDEQVILPFLSPIT